MAELTEEQVETVAEAVPEIVESLLALKAQFTLIGMSFGGLIGFLATRKYLEKKYQDAAEEEIDQMREHFRARTIVREEKPDLSELREKLEDAGYSKPNIAIVKEPENVEGSSPEGEVSGKSNEGEASNDEVAEEVSEEQEVTNIFDTAKNADDDWDYEEEVRLRRPDRAYIIHVDERHERDYTESSLVYYAGDDVLCDEQDTQIEDPDMVVGVDNLDKFGHGSHDKDILYIRNDNLAVEIEVVKNDGNFAEIVHGFVQHSDKSRTRRRRKHTYDDD